MNDIFKTIYLWRLFINFIINKGFPLSFEHSTLSPLAMTAGKNPRNFKKKGQKKKMYAYFSI